MSDAPKKPRATRAEMQDRRHAVLIKGATPKDYYDLALLLARLSTLESLPLGIGDRLLLTLGSAVVAQASLSHHAELAG